jgi:adenine-specific DNA-methyltransferase
MVTPTGTFSRYSKETLKRMDENNEIWFGKDGTAIPSRKTFLCDLKNSGTPSKTLWRFDEVGHNHEAREEVKAFNSNNVFATPKPERLIERVLTLATNPGDLVLDSFLGSGTTAAVAHKMGRRWIGVELGDHAYTHCAPRLKAVVGGEQGGISKAVNWKGGGGFKFYELAPSILSQNRFGNMVISDKYNTEMLAKAMAKHEGYTYAPSETVLWKQGYSGDKNFIFTTANAVTAEFVDYIASELGADEYLLICARSFDKAVAARYPNITVRPIPKILIGRCEYGRDNYDLNVILEDSDEWGEDDE